MNLKKIANVKNVICLTTVLLLGVGIYFSENKGTPKKKGDKDSSVSSEGETETETVTLLAAIPELSCGWVELGGSVVFANRQGSYSLENNGSPTNSIIVTDDGGSEVTLSANSGELTMIRNGEPAAGFVYNRHNIELKEGRLYYDSSPVEYKSESFSAYRLNDEYVVECTAKGQYRLKNSKGKYVDDCTMKENTGSEIKIFADEEGFYSEGVNDDFFYNVYKLNGDTLMTSWSYVLYVNGEELVPLGYDDKYTDEGDDTDAIELEPMEPPVNYGAVSTENEGISSLTEEMLGYVNEVREQYGMQPVYGLEILDEAADTRAKELAESFGHTRPDSDKSSYDTVISGSGMDWWRCGENIAKGGADSRRVFESWLASKAHRAVMLDPNMKYMSLAKYEKNGETYWEQLFFNDTYVPVEGEE